ncbi:head-tail connector protein [Sphingomonas sp. Leaf242]|uniref:head-tail connector protein n=1 Tax=Sphingomonas sp. Leaf242 TaxID=1736304 RepID=UPI0007163E45|nr:head-tail connector protein [Sphingomonas sp. Leaf242]KQO06908.1 hypothetical protein ASF09_11650 [Sphingomonas sp. Leaf242]
MNIIEEEQIQEWLRLDPSTDIYTLNMLVDSAIDVIEHHTGRTYLPYDDPLLGIVTPAVPTSIKHAIAVFVAAHFADREGATDTVMTTVRRLCAPFRIARL